MIEQILDFISRLTPFWIYVVLFTFAYIENVFPPSPSDLVVVIGGSLIGTGTLSFIPTLIITTVGSILGFMTLFFIGRQLDKKIIRAGKIKFISLEALDKVEIWFQKYGYWIILANRFLPGTRSVISFFGGLSELNVKRTILLASISAVIWNSIIIYLGMIFGSNVHLVDKYLSSYSKIAFIISLSVIAILVIRYFWKKKRNKN